MYHPTLKPITIMKNLNILFVIALLALPFLAQAQYTIGTPSSATATIVDDEASLAIADATAQDEGDSGDNTEFTFTVTRTGYQGAAISVDYTVSGGTATADDFESTTGTITFAANDLTKDITIAVAEDEVGEENETFNVVISNVVVTTGTGTVTISDDTGSSTINDDDGPVVSIAVAPSTVVEDASGSFVYTFTRTAPLANAITINFSVTGTADMNDFTVETSTTVTYSGTTGTITIPADETSADLTITPATDTDVEGDETVIVTITESE